MKEMDSELLEKSIHLLAFISRGTHCVGESSREVRILQETIIFK
jgi:nuclear pore complex protein Nup188